MNGILVTVRREKWWLAANAIGLIAFLHLASKTWIEPELRGLNAAARGGGTFVWTLSAMPVLLVFLFVDIAWLAKAVVRGIESRDWRPIMVVVVTAAIWAGAVALDQFNH